MAAPDIPELAIATGIHTVHAQAQGWTGKVAFTDVFRRAHGFWQAVSAQEPLRKPMEISGATH
ncbi:MAG: hypothetical protein JSS21_09550 [Proteobacteria bacterium]|nr:hypothetical protein [Pseudomonadota bacterium]